MSEATVTTLEEHRARRGLPSAELIASVPDGMTGVRLAAAHLPGPGRCVLLETTAHQTAMTPAEAMELSRDIAAMAEAAAGEPATTAEPESPGVASDALAAVLEAIDIEHAATAGGQEIRDKILVERAGHAVVMLRSILGGGSFDVPWSVGYLRDRLAEHPASGYLTWAERRAELDGQR